MTATYGDISRWVKEAEDKGARYLIIALDTFDYDNYPIFVMPEEDFWKKYPDFNNMQRVDEVYDMDMDLGKQMREERAWHLPART